MDNFSFTDQLRAAVTSCMPCLGKSPTLPEDDEPEQHQYHIRRARADELEGLLASSGDTDNEADAMSLHSNIGNGQRRTKKKKQRVEKRVSFFGWDLFGRRPAIQLPEDEENDFHSSALGHSTTSTQDSADRDAAPLDPSMIAGLSSEELQRRALHLEEEENRAREERRQRRRERKELKRVAAAMAMGGTEEDSFEGFQGSGGDGSYRPLLGAFQPPYSATSGSGSRDSRESTSFGPFVTSASPVPGQVEDQDDDADLGGELYTRKRPKSSAHSGSDSRSKSSSRSYSDPRTQQMQPSSPISPIPPRLSKKSRKPKSGHSESSISQSRSSASQSTSPPSPTYTSFDQSQDVPVVIPGSPTSSSGRVGKDQHIRELREEMKTNGDFPSTGFPSTGFGSNTGMPSPGIGFGGRRPGQGLGQGAAFLATRGDE